MADGSAEDRAGPLQMNDLTFSASDPSHGDTKKCSGDTFDVDRVKLSFYNELQSSESCEKSEPSGVAADRTAVVATTDFRKSLGTSADNGDERKKRCFDRYDSSESSDSGVAVLSPTDSGGCSGSSDSSDITEPRSPPSPESGHSAAEEGASARMPPWATDPAPGPRRLAAQLAPVRRPNPPMHRRITEYFNHKMKPQNGLKRDSSAAANDDNKKRCLSKNGVTDELEKYISYLSKTLSPKVLLDVGKQTEALRNSGNDGLTATDLSKSTLSNANGILEYCKPKDNNHSKIHSYNGFVEVRHGPEPCNKDKIGHLNGFVDSKKFSHEMNTSKDPSGNGITMNKQHNQNVATSKVAVRQSTEITSLRATSTSITYTSKKVTTTKTDSTKTIGVVSSTTKFDSRMNGVTCGSNNLSLNTNINKKMPIKREPAKRNTQSKRANRRSSACIANSKNMTWSKANNLKQVQLQKQNCINSVQGNTVKSVPGEATASTPKHNMPNGVRQIPLPMNGTINNHLNIPATNFQNCHPINIPQPCNGAVTTTNLPSFVAVPQNVMLTALRIPQNGLPAHTFNRQNVNVSSPTKLNGQYVFPLVQNINGTVVQIPNLMTKMPNYVLPQTQHAAAPRQDFLQNQQAAQFLIHGTLLKLANTLTSSYQNINKPGPVTSQPVPVMNKNVSGLSAVGMTVQPKPNYSVNLSHPLLVPSPGYIVTSVPNMNVKETWSYTNTNMVTSTEPTCSNPIINHPPPIVANFPTQALHSSSIPIAPVKPPDNPIQGTEPPSSTVKESEIGEVTSSKCDIPWLSKTVNNNIVPLDSNKITSRPFAQICSLSGQFQDLAGEKMADIDSLKEELIEPKEEILDEDVRKVEEVARREDTIFTQITVLKDVSSNVQNTVIEANFCNATSESSESGIGTDKSIDSPSDSQISKECDEDSSLSLSISISSLEGQSCQKSPILKQPKTLRFPPKSMLQTDSDQRTSSTDSTTTSTVTLCLWENCKRECESDTELIDHLLMEHVKSQEGKPNYVCLWAQCKVRGKPSCSRHWLERHAASHGGNKPFKCIVDGCDRRFSTQTMLERHVNHHFNESSTGSGAGKKAADSSAKLIRRNGKKLRYRRQPWSARMFDYFDAGTMEGLAWRLSRCTRWRLGGSCPLREPPGRHTLTLHVALAATRYNAAECRREALVTYYPPNVLEDEWVPEKEVRRIKRVEIADLPAHSKVLLYEQFCNSYRKTPSPPPSPPPPPPPSPRALPTRSCTSSRLLSNLIARKRAEAGGDCSATNMPMLMGDAPEPADVSGAKKRKLGRKYGGNAFWPSGR